MDGWIDEWMDEWIYGWINGCTHKHTHTDDAKTLSIPARSLSVDNSIWQTDPLFPDMAATGF